MKRVALLVLALAFSACSNSGNPSGNTAVNPGKPGTPGAPGQPPQNGQTSEPGDVKSGPAVDALTRYAWCQTIQNQGINYQQRLHFTNTEDFDIHVYQLQNGARAGEVAEAASQGNYSINGTTLTLMMTNGQTLSLGYRIDPQDAVTGAAKLHLSGQDGEAALDPCL